MQPSDVCVSIIDHLDKGGFKPFPNDMEDGHNWEHDSGSSWKAESNIEAALGRSAGIKPRKLGSGHFSYVFEDPYDTERVIKIAYRGYDASLDWYKFVLANPDPLFPKIYALVIAPDYYVVSLERLEPCDSSRDFRSRSVMEMIEQVFKQGYITYSPYIRHGDIAGLNLLLKFRHDDCRDSMSDYIDYGERNVMRRGDQLVVTDPIYKSPSRLKAVFGLLTIGHTAVRFIDEGLVRSREADGARKATASAVLPSIKQNGGIAQGHAQGHTEVLPLREEGIRIVAAKLKRGERVAVERNAILLGAIECNRLAERLVQVAREHNCEFTWNAERRQCIIDPACRKQSRPAAPRFIVDDPIRAFERDLAKQMRHMVLWGGAINPARVQIGLHGRVAGPRFKSLAKAKVPIGVPGRCNCGMVLGGMAHRNAIREWKLAGLRGHGGHRKRDVRGKGCRECCSPGHRDDRWKGTSRPPAGGGTSRGRVDGQRQGWAKGLEYAKPKAWDAGVCILPATDRARPEVLRIEAMQRFDFAGIERRMLNHLVQGA